MTIGIYKRPSPQERFWEQTNRRGPDECWEWTGAIKSTGRGLMQVNGKNIQAHRFSYELHNGKIPEGSFVCHKCDNPKCVNPNHLFLGDALINNRDCYAKGRHPILRGDNDPKSKLKSQEVLEIVRLYKTGKFSQYYLGKMFRVSRSTILNIIRGNNWSSITKIIFPIIHNKGNVIWSIK